MNCYHSVKETCLGKESGSGVVLQIAESRSVTQLDFTFTDTGKDFADPGLQAGEGCKLDFTDPGEGCK